MNKYDQFSLAHLETFIANERRQNKIKFRGHGRFADIISWQELKEIIERCKLREILSQNKRAQP